MYRVRKKNADGKRPLDLWNCGATRKSLTDVLARRKVPQFLAQNAAN